MSHRRWSEIRKYFHLSPSIIPESSRTDRYFKVRIMIEELLLNSKIYHPYSRHYSLDEMTIGYQGRTFLIKRTPSKKVSKAFQCVALSTDFGYVIDFEFDYENIPDSYPTLSATGNRVMRVCKYLKATNKYCIVFMDNRFSSPLVYSLLFKDLYVYATGTWRVNYGVPNLILIDKTKRVAVIDAAKEKGVQKCYCDVDNVRIVACSLYDNAPFYMLSTSDYEFTQTVGGTKKVERLDIVHDYNKHMHGNDIADSLLVAFPSYLRSQKYWFRLFHFLLDVGVNNAFLLFRILSGLSNAINEGMSTPIEHSAFLVTLVDELVDYCLQLIEELPKKKKFRSSEDKKFQESQRYQPHSHFAMVSDKRNRCSYCYINGSESKTSMYCSSCDVHLCLTKDKNCFEAYHSNKILKCKK